MNRLIDLVRSPVQVLKESITASEALQSLQSWGVSGAPVCDEGLRPLGVLTLSGLNTGVVVRDRLLHEPVREFMTPFIFGVSGQTPIQVALQIMVDNRIHRVFSLTDAQQVEGVFSAMDAMVAMMASATPGASGLDVLGQEWRALCQQVLASPVGEVMQSDLLVVRAEQSVHKFLRLCEEHRIAGAPVLGPAGQALGVVSQTDVARHLLHRAGLSQPLTVAEIMTPFSFSLHATDDLKHALQVMIRQHIHRVLVAEDGGRPVGVVSSLDVVSCLLARAGLC